MTTTPGATRPFPVADLGTLVMMPWSGEAADGRAMPYLLACSLGNGPGGHEGATAAVERLLEFSGLVVGGITDGTQKLSLPVTMLVVAGQAVVTMPWLRTQCTVPPEWLEAVAERGYAYLLFTTRPWPGDAPGSTVAAEALNTFAGDEETLKAAAHIILPARSLRA
ncbi:DUF5949 family protein [Streptomyces phaeoluteigriseus]|uniref:DUF5949 family protein n=1 Tax=Streptomyces phaeoluteigriseus TaxID=114686 RepID=A0ABY4ZHC0_9ACTN|nr:DUF5949 family protein [Streptomyces phaeoluteigriseus]USQ88404.1 DUF5949 family protein [Streptomyces phaeoluteigriseus]